MGVGLSVRGLSMLSDRDEKRKINERMNCAGEKGRQKNKREAKKTNTNTSLVINES